MRPSRSRSPASRARASACLVMRASLADAAEEDLQVAETVVGLALQAPIPQFARDRQALPRSGHAAASMRPAWMSQAAEADERAALAAPVADLAGPRQRRLELRVRLGVLPGRRQRAPATQCTLATVPLPSPGDRPHQDASSTPTLNGPRKLKPAQAPSSACAATSASPRAAARRQATTKLSSSAQPSAIAAFSSRPAKYAPCRTSAARSAAGPLPG